MAKRLRVLDGIHDVAFAHPSDAAEVKLIFGPEWPSKATSIEEIRKRTGTKPMSREDFDRHFGSLPTDGEDRPPR